jgi:hypothetical protein
MQVNHIWVAKFREFGLVVQAAALAEAMLLSRNHRTFRQAWH